MSVSADLQLGLAEMISAPRVLRAPVPVLARRQKELTNDIAAAVANHGLCVFIMPPLPMRAVTDVPYVFFQAAEIRLRIIENLAQNLSGVSGHALLDDLATGLHWRGKESGSPLAGLLVHPLQLSARPAEKVEDKITRIIDVRFDATYALPSAEIIAAPFEITGDSNADLQGAIFAQLRANLPPVVGLVVGQPKDLAAAIARAAESQILCVSIEPILPTRAMQGVDVVFYEAMQVRLRVSEVPALNGTGIDAYDLIELVMLALHWEPFAGLLSHPLTLAADPVVEATDYAEPSKVLFDVFFNATLEFQPPPL